MVAVRAWDGRATTRPMPRNTLLQTINAEIAAAERRAEIHAQTVRALLAVGEVALSQSRRSISSSIVSRSCVIVI